MKVTPNVWTVRGMRRETVTDPIEIQNRLLRASRELERRDDGLVATLRVENRNRMPVKFQLFDPLPGRVAAETVRFHPDDQPSHGRIDTEIAVVGGIVEPGDPHVTRYALQGQTLPSADELQRVHEAARPSIEISDIVGPGTGDEAVAAELEQATMTRSASHAPPDSDRPTADSSDLDQLWAGMDLTTDPTASDRSESSTLAAPDPPAQSSDEDDYPSLAEVVLGKDDAYRNRDSNSSEALVESTTDDEVDAAYRLLEQLEAGEVSEATRQRLVDHLVDALDAEPPRSLMNRIEVLESEVSAFGANLDSVEDTLEEHGSLEAFLGEVRQQVAELGDEMQEIQRELEGAAVTRSRTEETLEGVDETLERLAARTEHIDDRVETVREEQRERAEEIEARLERVERLNESVEELEAELESLAVSVEEHEVRPQSFWEGFFEDRAVEE